MRELVAVDVGGTHARFAIAQVASGRVAAISALTTLKTADHLGFEGAFNQFGEQLGRELPRAASIAIAGQVSGHEITMTNCPWVLRREWINEQVESSRFTVVNDLGAVAHSLTQLGSESFDHMFGGPSDLPAKGVISVVGPGTGLGVAQLIRDEDHYRVVETEGGHVSFAASDEFEDRLLSHLRKKHGRVSVERIISGAGLVEIYNVLKPAGLPARYSNPTQLWTAALAREDQFAVAALDRFCLILGSFAGDVALSQGADAVVIGGGLGARLTSHLPNSSFHVGFTGKGRFASHMASLAVKTIKHPEPGVLGAAAAFAKVHS